MGQRLEQPQWLTYLPVVKSGPATRTTAVVDLSPRSKNNQVVANRETLGCGCSIRETHIRVNE